MLAGESTNVAPFVTTCLGPRTAAARRTAVSALSVQRLPIAITYLSNTDGPPHVPVNAGGSVKTPVAGQLLLPEMGGITGFYEARTDVGSQLQGGEPQELAVTT